MMYLFRIIVGLFISLSLSACSPPTEEKIASIVANKDLGSLVAIYDKYIQNKDDFYVIQRLIDESFKQNFGDAIKFFNTEKYLYTSTETDIYYALIDNHIKYKKGFYDISLALTMYTNSHLDIDYSGIKRRGLYSLSGDNNLVKILTYNDTKDIDASISKSISRIYERYNTEPEQVLSRIDVILDIATLDFISNDKYNSIRSLCRNLDKKIKDEQATTDIKYYKERIQESESQASLISGYMVAQLNYGEYEVQINGRRAILYTKETEFSSQGRFSIYAKKTGEIPIETSNGFIQQWSVYSEISKEEVNDANDIIKEYSGYLKQAQNLFKNDVVESRYFLETTLSNRINEL